MDREMWILRQLETSLTASAEALAERLQVSPRTITNAINTLNRMLAPAASVRPTGGRYRLYILDPQEYSQIRSRLVRATDSLNDPRHRRAQEFGVLLSAKHPVTSDDLADIVCTSRTTVLADIARLREALKPLGVRIEGRSNQGFSLAAEELDLRLAELTLYPAELVDEYPIDDDIVAVVSRITGQAHLSKPSRHYVRRWLTVLLDRTLTGHPLDAMSEEYQRLRNTPAHRIASKLLTEAEDLVSTTFPIEEELFLAMSVAGMRTPDSAQGRQLFPADEEVPGLVDAIFERIAEIMQIHLDADELADEFAHHLTFMLNRIRFRVTIDEESVRSIRYQYPVAHRMAEISRDVIEERTGMRISDSETGLLTGYHQVFLDSHRACPYLRLAIVTATGRVSAHLMRIQLDKVLPHGTKYLMLTGDEADESTLARTDLVVATPDVDITTLAVGDVPVIQLGQVFDPAELISRGQFVITDVDALPRPFHGHASGNRLLVGDRGPRSLLNRPGSGRRVLPGHTAGSRERSDHATRRSRRISPRHHPRGRTHRAGDGDHSAPPRAARCPSRFPYGCSRQSRLRRHHPRHRLRRDHPPDQRPRPAQPAKPAHQL